MRTRTILPAAALLTAGALLAWLPAQAADDESPATLTEKEAYEIAKDAYVYAYPLLLCDITLRQQTNFAEPTLWSVTGYDTDGYFTPNALKRQALGDRDKLQLNPDGSLDLYLQAESPGKDKEANWLPVAKAPFTLLMRLYSPKSEVLDGTWKPPAVERVR